MHTLKKEKRFDLIEDWGHTYIQVVIKYEF